MTPAWATEATREEVQRKRQEFWDTRVQGSAEHWQALKAACEAADSRTAEAIVKASGLNIHQGGISLCVDSSGLKYELPPFMVNDALVYGQERKTELSPEGKNKPITVTVRSAKRPDVQLTVNTHDTGKALKSAYVSRTKATETVRLFYNGTEVKDTGYLGRLEEGVVVQALG